MRKCSCQSQTVWGSVKLICQFETIYKIGERFRLKSNKMFHTVLVRFARNALHDLSETLNRFNETHNGSHETLTRLHEKLTSLQETLNRYTKR